MDSAARYVFQIIVYLLMLELDQNANLDWNSLIDATYDLLNVIAQTQSFPQQKVASYLIFSA